MAHSHPDDPARVKAGVPVRRLTFFTPHAADVEARRCRYCRHWDGAAPGGVACGLVPFVCAGGYGCVYFEREAGTDDDLTR